MKRKNLAPSLGPDICQGPDCRALAQVTFGASHDTLRRLGYLPPPDDPTTMRVCVGCYLRGMAEAQARLRGPKIFTFQAQTGVK